METILPERKDQQSSWQGNGSSSDSSSVLHSLSSRGPVAQTAQASCGSVTCFVVIGSQQQVSPKGLLTVNAFYNYTPQGTLLNGTDGVIPAVDLDNRQLILDHHQEVRTISQMYTLDLNYGVTDRFGI